MKHSVKNNVLTIEVDLSDSKGKSKSGKSTIIDSTHGFVNIDEKVSFSLNVIRKK